MTPPVKLTFYLMSADALGGPSDSPYGSRNCRIHEKARVDLHDLPASDVRVHHVGEHGRDKSWRAHNGRRRMSTIEHMVHQDRLDSSGIIGFNRGSRRAVQEGSERFV